MSHGKASRRRPQDQNWSQREIEFTIPFEDNLARVHLERLDLFGELARVSREELSRHKSQISGENLRPPTPKRSGGAFGNAKLPPKRSRSVPPSSQVLQSSGNLLAAPDEVEPPKTKSLSKGFVLPSNNPSDMHNPHESRGRVVKMAVRDLERQLEASRSQSAAVLAKGFTAEREAFRWDRVPIGFAMSENQAEMFPRSIQATRMCGGGKNPALGRPWQDYEKWREAVLKENNARKAGRG